MKKKKKGRSRVSRPFLARLGSGLGSGLGLGGGLGLRPLPLSDQEVLSARKREQPNHRPNDPGGQLVR